MSVNQHSHCIFRTLLSNGWILLATLGVLFWCTSCAGMPAQHTSKAQSPVPHASANSFPNHSLASLPATPQSAPPHSVEFSGVITSDSCATSSIPIGDVGCSITISNTQTVYVIHGNAYSPLPWGRLLGFTSIFHNESGHTVVVFAHKLSPTTFTLQGSVSYFVDLTS